VQNYHCNGTGAQHWNEQATGLPDGSFFIVNQRSQKCIDGGQFWTVQWSCGPVPQQEWRLHTVPGAGAGQFQLENGNGKCLTLTSGNGADSQALSDDACFVNNWFGQLWEVD
jgi:Ricin-type beta-trefoil lectin domain-like